MNITQECTGARRHGHSWYVTGEDCPHGHVSPRRRLKDSYCLSCMDATALRHRRKSRKSLYPVPTRSEPKLCECCGHGCGKRAFNLDHDHATGAFRGWLCGNCNRAIGLLGDTVESVERALNYLRRANGVIH